MPTAQIRWISPEGSGTALDETRRTVHIPGTIPGDIAEWTVTKETKRRVDGELVRLVEQSEARRAPSCPHDAQCGGCDLSFMKRQPRLQALAHVVQRALRLEQAPEIVSTPSETGHRARIKLTLADGAVGYRAHRSHALIAIETCEIAHPKLQEQLGRLRAWVAAHPDTPLNSVEIRTDGERVVYAFSGDGHPSREEIASLSVLEHVAIKGRPVHGDPTLMLPSGRDTILASASTFFQVNLALNAQMVDHVVRWVADAQPERVLDMYAGIGNFSIPIARLGPPVIAVEREGQSIRDLRATAERLELRHVSAVAMPAERFDPTREPYDVAVLDPPRRGTDGVLKRVLRNRPRRVVYVSCHIPAGARDIREAIKQGYRVVDVTCFDLFPKTHHVETVIVLDR